MRQLNDKQFELFLTSTTIDHIVTQTASKVEKYIKTLEQPVIFVIVLKGAVPFAIQLTDLLSYPMDIEMEYIRLSSYEGTQSSGNVIEVLGISQDISGRDIVIVEDIVETGLTMQHLKNYLINEKQVNSVKICSLFTRPKNYTCDIVVDFVGMELNNDEFIVGYGLDYNELGRNLKAIYKLVD